ncbi:SH3 domain-containing protein [Allonocardiopsis opalescens]|uniref:SH3 domain-containing protein n=1 Tax=Allonocardiopsis opalescens TaxID=1144618 RepID=A0A2T0QEM7_9ACTN|nr:SH3 domain-containing protein [Allonocardiopsis opalescens]PRY02303.1 hypothetical protein CLV72_101905 [Allonocardiopsis opalescens]
MTRKSTARALLTIAFAGLALFAFQAPTSAAAIRPDGLEQGSPSVQIAHAPCGTAGPNLDGTIGRTIQNNVNMRTGSSTGCTSVGQAQTSHQLIYYCYTVGNDGYTWTYVRNVTTARNGWIRDDLLLNYGSWSQCPF